MNISSIPNPDLAVTFDDKPNWEVSDNRRAGWHNLPTTTRYSMTLRAEGISPLSKEINWKIGDRSDVSRFLAVSHFSAFAVVRGDRVIFESYAPDFGPQQTHSVQSITKTHLNLMLGRVVADGLVDLDEKVGIYLPEIGSAYANATVRDVSNMNIENDYTEDWSDPNSLVFDMDAAIGWRPPREGQNEKPLREFLCGLTGSDLTNHGGELNYKSANTEILAWIVERVSGRPLRDWLLEIVEAAGYEGCFHISCDRVGVPILAGGVALTARDLARYGLLFARGGEGVDGRKVGDAQFIEETRKSTVGPTWETASGYMRYNRAMFTNGTFLGHGGWGGQYLLVNPDTDTAVVYFSVLENRTAEDLEFFAPLIEMMDSVAAS
ncbi:serine hydrolase [Glutamicibacter sp. JC586]|uniref:serine hydrolase domain-containing protein n=1 Tax=Glutamicibacter sp. JC586 TaxID=2590552 RepID=UPI001358E05C|nr:serine hydrolase [Glutamicibacter sp. JC586]